ncbi:hypothetical protein ABZS76_33460 [Streptomyces sp. NPDC005562]|uniref:hypothetical protein n=1 Tax=Streptomyces sp. NPDC005562 TaxID=3154890 RepID=UPI0033A5FCD5
MHLREPATRTLADLDQEWKSHDRTWTSDACVPEVDFQKPPNVAPVLSLGDHEINLDDEAVDQLCAFYAIPTAYFGRITPREKHFVMNARIDHAEGEVTIAYNGTGVTGVRKPSQPRLDVEEFVRIAHRLYPASSTVLDAWVTPEDLRLDILDGTSLDGGLKGGVRLAQNRKQNLAPTVSPILFHEPTTTVLQIPDLSLRIDARGVAVEKIAERLAAEALRADARLSNDAAHLLKLQETSITGDRITRLHRVASEHSLPVRPLADITVTLSRADDPTLFDLAIAIANTANAPKLQDPGKRSVRARLQGIAGAIVTDEAERCASCHALVTAA